MICWLQGYTTTMQGTATSRVSMRMRLSSVVIFVDKDTIPHDLTLHMLSLSVHRPSDTRVKTAATRIKVKRPSVHCRHSM